MIDIGAGTRAVLLSGLVAAAVVGQEPSDEAEPAPVTGEAAETQPCRQPAGGSWLDWLQRNVYRSVCLTALWFDDFFGDERVASERAGTWGRLAAGGVWDERDDVEGTLRLRAKLALPRMQRRLHAVIGRNESDRPSDIEVAADGVPEAFRDTDEDWLTGLEYEPVRNERHDLDLGIGVRLSSPVDPYVRLRYRLQHPLSDRWLLRWQVTPFWRDSTRLGLGHRTDFDFSIRQGLLLRLSGAARLTESSEGIEWQVGPTLYQRLGATRALAYRLVGEGAAEDGQHTGVLRLETLLRQRLHREWLVLELEPRLEWRRPSPEERRQLVPGFGLVFEMRFGEHQVDGP